MIAWNLAKLGFVRTFCDFLSSEALPGGRLPCPLLWQQNGSGKPEPLNTAEPRTLSPPWPCVPVCAGNGWRESGRKFAGLRCSAPALVGLDETGVKYTLVVGV